MALDPYFEPEAGGDNAFTVEAPKIKFGAGSLAEIGDDAKALGMTRVALFTDPVVADLEPFRDGHVSLLLCTFRAFTELVSYHND